MADDLPYSEKIWNSVERKSYSELVIESIPNLLYHQIEYSLKQSPFYQKKYSGLKLPGVEEILAFHDTLPLTDKSELISDQELFPP